MVTAADAAAPERAAKVLYVLACGAGAAPDVHLLVRQAQERGWEVCLITSPRGRTFVDVAALEELTGHPVRSEYRLPHEPDVLPPADAMIVAPATTNTVNKWAAGIQDTLLLGLIVEGIGKRLPIVAMPFSNEAQAAHPAFGESIAKLRCWGVTVLYGPEVYDLQPPGTGDAVRHLFPWHLALDALDARRPGDNGERG